MLFTFHPTGLEQAAMPQHICLSGMLLSLAMVFRAHAHVESAQSARHGYEEGTAFSLRRTPSFQYILKAPKRDKGWLRGVHEAAYKWVLLFLCCYFWENLKDL